MTVNPPSAASSSSKKILIILAIILLVCFCLSICSAIIGFSLFSSPPKTSSSTPEAERRTPASPAVEPSSTTAPGQQTWLVMFYLDADDPVLEEDMFYDFNEIELVGSTERVKMVAQIDRLQGRPGDQGESARRFYVTKDQDLNKINSKLVEDLGEVEMSNPQTLVDFATWAIKTYPADRYVLILSDHGMGWPGGWTDENPKSEPIQFITTARLDRSLKTIIEQTGISQFELVGLDACLMSMLEVYNALAPHAHYAVASEEIEPGVGWAYTDVLQALTKKPEMSGADLGKVIVNSYVNKDQRIVNDKARAGLISSYGYPTGTSANDLIKDIGATITLSAVDLSALPAVNQALNDLAIEMKSVSPKKVADVRSYARSFTNLYGENTPSPYIDLGHFATLLAKKSGSPKITGASDALKAALKQAVIAERHGTQRKGATGISIYFPTSNLYWSETLSGLDSYTKISQRFAEATLWDDFLAYHYAKQEFGAGKPSKEQRIPAPGAAEVNIAPLQLSTNSIKPGQALTLQTEISGEQIAYIYIMNLYKKDDNNYLMYNLDYIQGDRNEESDGVYYPVWDLKDGRIPISLNWTPSADAVCNGDTCAFNLLEPESYGASKDDIVYSVIGKYISASANQTIDARMFFSNDTTEMRSITAYSGSVESGITASDLSPTQGDRWLNLETWILKDDQGKYQTRYHPGWELPFAQKLFYFRQTNPDPGNYLVAIVVEDMDGQLFYQFAPFSITQ